MNVAGKNRLLTSQFLHEVYSHLDSPSSHPVTKLNELEQNILFLKNGGDQNNLKLNPLDEQFEQEWKLVYDQFVLIKTNFETLYELESELTNKEVLTLEIDSLILIDYSDNLVNEMGLLLDRSTEMLIIFQILLLIINVFVHVMMIILISKIFRKEFEATMKIEKLATVGELSSRLAHDMRNPLSYINMSTQLLKSKTTEKETTEKLEIIEKGIARMSHQINDVMDFVRSKEPELRLWNLKSILKECFDRLNLPDSVKVTLPKNSVLVKCDRTQFEVLFINLISNAADAIKNNGSIEARITTNPDVTKIEIIDSGEGIPQDKLEEIFDPLVTYKEFGTGLGLASRKNIVENHKGKISVKNNPTTFSVILPNY